MDKFSVKALAAAALLTLGVSNGFAQESDEVMVEDESVTTSVPADMGEEAPIPADEEAGEYSEEY